MGTLYTLGEWPDERAITAWRDHPGFQSRVADIRELLEAFTPHTMEAAAETGPPTPDP